MLDIALTPSQMRCEVCHERDATVHSGTGSEGTFSRHFCQQCFQERGPLTGVQILEGAVARCHYCGAKCDFGGPTSKPMSTTIPGAVITCRECRDDLMEYVQKLSQPVSSQDQFDLDLEAYMKRRVADRQLET